MSFVKASINISYKAPGEVSTGIRAGIRGMKVPRLFLNITNKVVKDLNWQDGYRLEVLLGEGEHHGLIRLKVDNENGSARLDEVKSAGDGYFQVLLGNQPLYVQQTESPHDCQWEEVEDGYVEIVLPKWADATRPVRNLAEITRDLEKAREVKAQKTPAAPSRKELLEKQSRLLEQAVAEQQSKKPIAPTGRAPVVTRKVVPEQPVVKVARKPAAPNPEPMYAPPKKITPKRQTSNRMQEVSRKVFGDPSPSRSALADKMRGDA